MNQTALNYIDGETLMTTMLPPIRFVVSGLLPQGLNILAGAPKVGKSWLALWLCLNIAKGNAIWKLPVTKGDVLYLCLEDSYSRIQNRLLDITDNAPDNLFFCTMSEKLRSGLEEQIEGFLSAHPKTALVVIDTLQRIRTVTSNVSPYASDYQDLGALKQLADKHHIAVLLIHHLRKMNDDDPMNMISGTTGICGAADSSFVLRKDKRSGSTAMLYCTGRDIEYRELALQFDSATHIWNLVSDSVTPEPIPCDSIIFSLCAFLRENEMFSGTATELAQALESYCEDAPLPMGRNSSSQAEYLKQLTEMRGWLPTRNQMDELLKRMVHLEQMLEQAGKPKGRVFSPPGIRLPRLRLPRLDGPTWISLLMVLTVLPLLWWGLGGVWSNLSLLFP